MLMPASKCQKEHGGTWASENPPPSTSFHTAPAKGPSSNQLVDTGTLASKGADHEDSHTQGAPMPVHETPHSHVKMGLNVFDTMVPEFNKCLHHENLAVRCLI